MRSAETIKKLIKNTKIKTNPEVNKAVLDGLLDQMDRAEGAEVNAQQPNTWSIIMKSKITKFAAVAVIIIAALIGINQFGGSIDLSSTAFAEVIQQIHNARTATFITEVQMGQGVMKVKNFYKEPGLKRNEIQGGTVVIDDLAKRKAIVIFTSERQYIERDIEHEEDGFFEYLKTLPERATEVLENKEIDGRIVQGFCVVKEGIDTVFWIDVKTNDLVRLEGKFPNAPNTQIVGTNFKFDVELDDALFSLIPPDGYTRKELPKSDKSKVNHHDLINLLRWWATNMEGHFFPPSLEPAAFGKIGMEMKKAGKLLGESKTKEEKMQLMTKLSRGLQFAMMMRPENDWHYAGEGVELGDSATPIWWYRPQDSQTYRVIYGDLTFEDVAPEDLPK